MTRRRPPTMKLVLFLGDIVLSLLGVYLAALLRSGGSVGVIHVYNCGAVIFIFLLLSLLYVVDLYNPLNLVDWRRTFLRALLACSGAGLVSSTLYPFLPPSGFGRSALLMAVMLLILLIHGWRRFLVHHDQLLFSRIATLIIGTGNVANEVRSLLGKSKSLYKSLGFIRVGSNVAVIVPPEEVVGEIMEVERITAAHNVRCIVVAEDSLSREAARVLMRLRFQGVTIFSGVDFSVHIAEELPTEVLSDSWLWFAGGFNLFPARLARKIKRLSDLLLSSTGLLLTLPLSLVAALLIKLDSDGPVFYKQHRVGWLEQPFELIKFRSMRLDAEGDGKPQWASVNDPRVTRIGHLIRRLHIDELPQLINVLRGEMSFVGPRPERPEFVEELKTQIPFYHLRHYIPPGITGW